MPKYIRSRLLSGVAAAAMVCLCTAAAPAQERPAAPAQTAAKIPVGPGSLNGVWISPNERFGERSVTDRDPTEFRAPPGVVLLPWAKAVVDKRFKDTREGHPFATTRSQCLPAGMPDQLGGGMEEIVESPNDVAILTESGWHFNVIHMNVPHRVDPDPTYMGDSIGHWEGDTLVVDTIAISTKTSLLGSVPHSELLHVMSRIRRVDQKNLEFKITVEDPKTFEKPFTITRRLVLFNEQLNEFICDNDRNTPDANGNLTVVAPGTK
jgi:hypothetical protein